MVAIQPSSRNAGRFRVSILSVISCVLAVAVIYALVLLSFASRVPKIVGVQETDIREGIDSLREDMATKKEKRQNTGFSSNGKPMDNGSNQHSTSGTGPRGRSNFRNVVFPKASKREPRMAGWMAKPHGEGVKPQTLVPGGADGNEGRVGQSSESHPDPEHVLKAFVEPIDFKELGTKPLPRRSTATADQLEELSFPKLNSCDKVPEMIPADEYPDYDPFLPWIHDVFPTHDGKFIQIVAQNRRRCHTGTTPDEKEILYLTQPNVALFQHVPVKRVKSGSAGETRYQLTSHDQADEDGVATRFICRFKPSMTETLSVYNFDYDFAAHRKRTKNTFKENDGGILSVHLSQLIFRCPVPEELVDVVKSGESVKNDWATLFVDVIPIRTPPRYGLSNAFMQPKYSDRLPEKLEDRFDPAMEWGDNHLLPRIEDSGRWENLPICKPTIKEYYPDDQRRGSTTTTTQENKRAKKEIAVQENLVAPKKHRLVACMWASAGYTTRGNRFAVNDGQRRMLEWITFNKMLGFEHFYLYDNSYAYSDEITLKPVADMFPDDITYIKWPFQICNNNPNNVDSPGERSSQYAAESSCRLRFGPHVEWIGQFDIDEYFIPMGNYASIIPILDELDKTGTKILSFGSWRAWPRRDLIEKPILIEDPVQCGNRFGCFELHIPPQNTVLQTYNCDRQSGPKKDVMPAEKQLYRPDYVLQHFIHYSSVTVLSNMNRSEFESAGFPWLRTRITPDPLSRFSDELNEATMLHTKAVARQDTAGWQKACKIGFDDKRARCRVGVPFPVDYDEAKHGLGDNLGWAYNCYVNRRTEEHWVPLLEEALKKQAKTLASP